MNLRFRAPHFHGPEAACCLVPRKIGVIGEKVHINVTGFLGIAALANKLNHPLSDKLLTDLSVLGSLPDVKLEHPVLSNNPKLDPSWVSGFIAGEGSFSYFARTRTNKLGITLKDYTLAMEVSQKTFDSFILVAIQQIFNAGNIYHGNNGVSRLRITTREDIITKLIPHFNNYPVSGFKELQYSIWLEILNVLK